MMIKQRIINVDMRGCIHRLTYIHVLISYTYMYIHTCALSYGEIGFTLVINYFKQLKVFLGKTGFYLFLLTVSIGQFIIQY
jgi:hypothetical protein